MASSEERRRILDLLAAGKVNADQAASLLKALGPTPAESLPLPPGPRSPEPPRRPDPGFAAAAQAYPEAVRAGKRPRFVRIKVDAAKDDGKTTNVDVRVPYALAKFALRFVPAGARRELEAQGIDITQLLEASETLSEGKIVEVDAAGPDDEGTAHITIEVI
ncbi:MAG TPA: hypothetical protein VF164_08155 [Trueperaceae bacterium]